MYRAFVLASADIVVGFGKRRLTLPICFADERCKDRQQFGSD